MVDVLGLGLGLSLVLIVVALHYSRGTEWRVPDDISQEVLERRAATVPETDFPEPMNRSIGGGGGAVAVGGGAEGELEGEGDEEEGFDPAAISEDEVEYFEVEYVNEGSTIEVANNETLLEAGEDEGWDLPYACRQGQCLSCGGKVTDGDAHEYVRHSNNETLGEDEVEKGYILTCTAYPTADLSLETNETP
ncbi:MULTISPECIES: 2Fe-2S iron-sulfur cluster-binding protein [Halorussus]|uniref:2Fe-2S iron-sulfur cluster-binding protein n=1 Tax=Halorussus TaxID=1070314 RepID=UPI00209D5847|nr:2Fe-2S iron-sulfur cluster-binding protein [Halorussus vallis]USZ74566.1 2Fe-2S iron-sulfur cluster-binding protein [Halorussus vallis]